MYLGTRLCEALSRLNAASSTEARRDTLADAALQMGFPYVALVQHGRLPRLVDQAMVITNYPAEFVQSHIENHHYMVDPVYDVSQQLDRPFSWDEIPDFIDLTSRQLALFEEARRYGIVAGFAFKTALHLHHPPPRSNAPKLSRREAEGTVLVAFGKSDWQIGKILDLGQTTANISYRPPSGHMANIAVVDHAIETCRSFTGNSAVMIDHRWDIPYGPLSGDEEA